VKFVSYGSIYKWTYIGASWLLRGYHLHEIRLRQARHKHRLAGFVYLHLHLPGSTAYISVTFAGESGITKVWR